MGLDNAALALDVSQPSIGMKTLAIEEFQAACKQQAASMLETVVVCPVCKTLQSGEDFVAAGMDVKKVGGVLGYSCVGRYTGAKGPRKEPDGQPCNWTLAGLFQLHTLEVVTPDGEKHPHFELASDEAAQEYRQKRAAVAQGVAK